MATGLLAYMKHSSAVRSTPVYYFQVCSVHELHNEDWIEYQDFLKFKESKQILDLPYYLRDGVRMDLLGDAPDLDAYLDLDPSYEEIMQTETIRCYLQRIKEEPPRDVPLEEGMQRRIVASDESDPQVVARMMFASNHHWGVESCERIPEPSEPEDYFLRRADYAV
jgi:hypothetical protein